MVSEPVKNLIKDSLLTHGDMMDVWGRAREECSKWEGSIFARPALFYYEVLETEKIILKKLAEKEADGI